MKILIFALAYLVCVSFEADAAALDLVKNAAKNIGKTAADAADQVTEVPQNGGFMQKVLHKTTSLALDKGFDVMSAKVPLMAVAAPHLKKFSKPLANKAHEKINQWSGDKATEATKEAESAATAAPEEAPRAPVEAKKDEPEAEKKEEKKKVEKAEKKKVKKAEKKKGKKVEKKEEKAEEKKDDKAEAEEEKKGEGLMGKLKNLVGANDGDDKKPETKAEKKKN